MSQEIEMYRLSGDTASAYGEIQRQTIESGQKDWWLAHEYQQMQRKDTAETREKVLKPSQGSSEWKQMECFHLLISNTRPPHPSPETYSV